MGNAFQSFRRDSTLIADPALLLFLLEWLVVGDYRNAEAWAFRLSNFGASWLG